MTAKEFLRALCVIDRRVDETQERIERLESRLESGRMSQITGMPRGGDSDWTKAADLVIELKKRMEEQICGMIRWKLAAVDAINMVDEFKLREVLELHYMDGMTWEQVAERMGYEDVRWVYELHGRALSKISVPEEYAKKTGTAL